MSINVYEGKRKNRHFVIKKLSSDRAWARAPKLIKKTLKEGKNA